MAEKILGVDYGRRKIGLSISESTLAEPLGTLGISNFSQAVNKIMGIIQKRNIKKVIIGLPTGVIENDVRKISRQLKNKTSLPIVLWDESLTTKETRRLMISSGKSRMKRKKEEHQVAAALLLQDYLDSQSNSC